MSALDTTARDLAGALSGIAAAVRGPSPVLAETVEKIVALEPRLRESRQRLVEAGAAICVREPWRIGRAIYGLDCPLVWPVEGKSAGELLADARRRIASQRELRRTGHWCHDPSLLIAAEQAERALVRMDAHPGTGRHDGDGSKWQRPNML